MKSIIHFVLQNRLLLLVLGTLVVFAGYLSYRSLPVDAFPDVSPSLVQIFTITEGLSPEEVEKYVTYPVEVSMMGLPSLRKIRSVSNFGLSVVNLYFEDGTDIYFARQVVSERLQEAREQIPAGFGEPEMGPISTGMGLVLFYYLRDKTGKHSLTDLRTLQDWVIKFHLQTVPGVTEVLGIGGWEKQFSVVVNPKALIRYKVTLSEIIEKIRANNLNVGAQFLEKNAEEYIVRSVGLARKIEDLKEIIIKTEDGIPLYLHQFAKISIGGAIRRGVQTSNGKGEVVAGMVVKLYGTNSSTVIEKVEKKLQEINKILPPGVEIVPYYQQKELVEECVSTVSRALQEGALLVVLILFFFMGNFRSSLVVLTCLPFSILFATLCMKYFGISANLMSLGGIAIAIGMMLDGAIVIVENVDRLFREGSPQEDQISLIYRACVEVIRPICFAISIIVIVFLPLFTLQGVEGKTFKPLAYTIALTMVGSLLFSLFLAPVFCSFFLKKAKTEEGEERENLLVRLLLKIYRPVVSHFVSHRGRAISLASLLILLGLSIFPFLGSEFTPTLQEGTIVLRLTMAPSISLRESTELTLKVERRLMKVPEVDSVVTRIGRGEVGAHTDPVNSAEVFVILKPKDQWRTARSQADLVEVLRKSLGDVPGVLTNFTQPIQMTVDELMEGIRAELAIKLFGDDLYKLKKNADQIASVLRKVPGAADVQVDQVSGAPQLLIRVNRKAIARYGLNVEDVQKVIRSAVGGEVAGQVFEGIRRFNIYVRYPLKYRSNRDEIGEILIPAPGGIKVPLSQLASLKEVVGSRQITREDNQRFITIQCNVEDRDIGSFVEEAQRKIDREVKLPAGYLSTWGGQFRLQQEANKRFAIVIPLTLLLIFLLLFGNFNSVKNSLLILLNIPLALVGGIVGLYITGQNLSVPSSVGFIALFGIALLNGVILVSYINQLLLEGLSLREACIKGACLRLRPVLMTATVTALGLVPLLFSSGTGSEVQRPLATVVVGGLVTSTALTLLVIPALYRYFASSETKKEEEC